MSFAHEPTVNVECLEGQFDVLKLPLAFMSLRSFCIFAVFFSILSPRLSFCLPLAQTWGAFGHGFFNNLSLGGALWSNSLLFILQLHVQGEP